MCWCTSAHSSLSPSLPSGEGSTNCLRFLLNLMNVQSSNIKIQSVGWYHLHDCAMAHQRFIFQGSEERCPLKEDVKVDDGFGKLAFWKPNIKLDTGSEWVTSLPSHFLNILLLLLIFNTTYEISSKIIRLRNFSYFISLSFCSQDDKVL